MHIITGFTVMVPRASTVKEVTGEDNRQRTEGSTQHRGNVTHPVTQPQKWKLNPNLPNSNLFMSLKLGIKKLGGKISFRFFQCVEPKTTPRMAGFQFCSKLDTYLNLPQFICPAPKADSDLGSQETGVMTLTEPPAF